MKKIKKKILSFLPFLFFFLLGGLGGYMASKHVRLPFALRTAYACALLLEKDEKKAERLGNDFLRLQASYPYPGEIVSEQALMLLARRRAQGENLSL